MFNSFTQYGSKIILFQVTNYGLGGLCEVHMDPIGYFEGREIPPERAHTVAVGDYLATLMAWLKVCLK